jgi:ribosomal protein S14
MRARKEKNIKLRIKYSKKEISKKITKFLYLNILTNQSYRKKSFVFFLNNKSLRNRISKTFIKNICVLSSRGRAVNKIFSISRIHLRNLIASGSIFGYKKAVW